jgi:hypothetical protein
VQVLVGLFAWVIVPRRVSLSVEGPFPPRARHGLEVPDVVLDRGVLPFLRGAVNAVMRLRLLQRGAIQVYVLYILFALLGLLFVR